MNFNFSIDFSIAWGIWALAFIVIEGLAVFNERDGDTLSYHVWAGIAAHPYLIGLPVLFLLAWTAKHFFVDSPFRGT